MKKPLFSLCALVWALLPLHADDTVAPPAPVAPVPTAAQVAWHKMETYAFIHFGLNTFADREWGFGDTPLQVFNPKKLDAEQWARTLKAAGMTGVILTAKHHDGFCLWPTRYTDYSVRNTPYKDGKGDIVGELAAAAKKYGLKLGIYLSPWDRHQPFYGTPLYISYYHAQLQELLTQYGDVFEVWLDGANGGDGWYGGANTSYKIDRRSYYEYPKLHEHVWSLHPDAIIFSDGGPGCRWVGNEDGYAAATNWDFLRSGEVYPGYGHLDQLTTGHPDGDAWVPAECNTSIRPGWFWHEKENDRVKTVAKLTDIYYCSVGRGGTFLLNTPIDTDGLIHPIDSARLMAFHQHITGELANDLCPAAKVSVSTQRGKTFGAACLTDGNYDTYWATADGQTTGDITVSFRKPTRLNRLMLQEYIPLGQRVQAFVVEYKQGKQWVRVNCGEETSTVGYKRLLRFPTVQTTAVRVRFTAARGPLTINRIAAFCAPQPLEVKEEKAAEMKGLPFTVVGQDAESVTLDLGATKRVRFFGYLPAATGIIDRYALYTGDAPDKMQLVAEDEFSNIRANPIMQELWFTPRDARYVRLVAKRTLDGVRPMQYKQIVVK